MSLPHTLRGEIYPPRVSHSRQSGILQKKITRTTSQSHARGGSTDDRPPKGEPCSLTACHFAGKAAGSAGPMSPRLSAPSSFASCNLNLPSLVLLGLVLLRLQLCKQIAGNVIFARVLGRQPRLQTPANNAGWPRIDCKGCGNAHWPQLKDSEPAEMAHHQATARLAAPLQGTPSSILGADAPRATHAQSYAALLAKPAELNFQH